MLTRRRASFWRRASARGRASFWRRASLWRRASSHTSLSGFTDRDILRTIIAITARIAERAVTSRVITISFTCGSSVTSHGC